MADSVEEWFFQADYDLDTARYMLDGGRRFYAVYMAHLAVEKALKGVYQDRRKKMPPKIHNLVLLIELSELEIDAGRKKFSTVLTQAQIAARYPVRIADAKRTFSKQRATKIVAQAKETIQWAKTLL